jgi:tRNA G18 (ribose-2'-O)-methylase SpoU
MIQRIETLDDPRVAAFRNLPDRTLRGESIFVTEGRSLTERLLASRYEAEAVLCAAQHAEEFAAKAAGRCPVYSAPERLLMEIVGFNFHLGVMGAGRRGTPATLDDLMTRLDPVRPITLAICPEVTKPENLGLVFRSAAALGIDGVLLGRLCCDPFSRRALRVSMGGLFRVPWGQVSDVPAAFQVLHRRWGVELAATVLDPAAERIDQIRWPARLGLVFGSEYDGLRHHWLELCQRRVTIPMQPGTDSLNLGVAAGIFLYEANRRERT